MEIYNDKDLELLKNNMDDIQTEVDKQVLYKVEPTKKEQDAIVKIVMDFIKRKKRKIYGGFALNKILINKNPKDAIYSEYEAPDIDFYSPDPLRDLIELVNLLHDAGFKHVIGQEAQHEETYKIFVNLQDYVDISYVPKKIYNKMPFVTIDDINYIGPFFIMIDRFRMFTDPLVSSFRWTKEMPRLSLLQKYYPIKNIDRPLTSVPKIPTDKKTDIKQLLNTVFNFLINRKTTITTGWYAYNYFINESKFKSKNITPVEIPYYEFISTDYVNDANELIKTLKKENPKLADKVGTIEYYPFFQFTGFSATITYDSVPIAKISDYNHRCTPFVNVKPINFDNSKTDIKKNDIIQMGSFSLVFLMNMFDVVKYRTNDMKNESYMHRTILSNLLKIKKYYLNKNNKNILDNTIFKDFIIDCIGDIKTLFRDSYERKQKKKEQNKPYVFKYEPESGNVKTEPPNYIFANSAGTPIKNEKNLKLNKN